MNTRGCLTHSVTMLLLSLLLVTSVSASEEGELYKSGYRDVTGSHVKGTFDGCEPGQEIPLEFKRKFICNGWHKVEPTKKPWVRLFKHPKTGDFKVLIDGHEYDGELVDAEGVKIREKK